MIPSFSSSPTGSAVLKKERGFKDGRAAGGGLVLDGGLLDELLGA